MIYVGIPVHDERHTIGPLLWRIRQLLSDRGRGFHILVLDDASTDGTSQVLDAYDRVLPMTLLRHETRRGYAASLERLVREAVGRSDYPRRDALVTLQADFTDAPEAIPEMVRRFEGGMDLVVCAPSDPSAAEAEDDEGEGEAGREPVPEPRPVRLARLGARFLARGLPTPPGVRDPFGSLRLYRLFTLARALDERPDDGESRLLTQEGWAGNAELLLAVWPHVRRMEELVSPPDYGRRYRDSRFRAVSELWSLRRVARHPRVRNLEGRALAEG